MDFILTGDIGGTNPKLAMLKVLENNLFDVVKIKDIKNLSDSIVVEINSFLGECAKENMTTNSCCLAVAGPVENNSCLNLTNSNFVIDSNEIINNTFLENVLVINDFAAIAEVVASIDIKESLKEGNLRQLFVSNEDVLPLEDGNRVVVGPGTDLGVCDLIYDNGDYIISSTEIANTSIGVVEGLEDFYDFLRKKNKCPIIRKGDIVSGVGIKNIMEFFLDTNDAFSLFLMKNPRFIADVEEVISRNLDQVESDEWFKDILIKEAKGEDVDLAVEVSKFTKSNAKAKVSMKLFFEFFGLVCQDIVLSNLDRGGLFIVSNIVRKNQDFLFEGEDFSKWFAVNLKMSDYLKKVPIYVLDLENISFLGCGFAFKKKFR